LRALITGGAGGLGYETARALVCAGHDVVLADCNLTAGREAAARLGAERPGRATFLPLDLADLGSVRRSAAEISTSGPLDVLVNNAGVLPPLRRAETRDGFERALGISHFGHFTLTAALLPALLRSPAPRVVSASSIVHARGVIDFDDLPMKHRYRSDRAYARAKLASLLFALELQRRADAAGARLTSVAAHPGVARTGIGAGRRCERRRGVTDWLDGIAFGFAMRVLGQAADEGARSLVYAALNADVDGGGYYGPGGFLQCRGAPARHGPAPVARDAALAARLWDVSEQLTGARYDWSSMNTAMDRKSA